MKQTAIWFGITLTLSASNMALAADPLDVSNVFTPPDAEQNAVPTYKESDGDKQRRAFLGGEKPDGGLGMFNRVRNIPSLTPQQRKDITSIFTKAKADFQPIKEQLDQLRSQYQNDPQKIMGDPQSKEKFLDLRRQVRDMRKQLTESVNSILTPQQQQELEAMRRGELMPATFNPPVVQGNPHPFRPNIMDGVDSMPRFMRGGGNE